MSGIVDAAVSGGISNYKLFFSEDFLNDNPDKKGLVSKLKKVTQAQMGLLSKALEIHGDKVGAYK